MVEGSTAGVISKDSSNIVSLVRKQYKAITTKMAVTVEASAGCKVEKVRALDCPQDDCSKVVVILTMSQFSCLPNLFDCADRSIF